MILGHGDVASALYEVDRPDLFFFASGVSNSQEKDHKAYARERNLLARQNRRDHIVYFGSLSVFYSDTRYTRHKLDMERLVKTTFSKYTIVRLGNISWGNNPNTIINYFKKRKEMNEPLVIEDAYRYIVDKHEFQHWMRLIPKWNCEMNVTGRMLKVSQIVEEYVNA